MRLYKFLAKDGMSTFQNCEWSLPKGKRPGKWMPKIEGELIECQNGYHLCRPKDLPEWAARHLFEAEHRGELVECATKVIVREARIVREVDGWEKIARLFATDCAARVLSMFERKMVGDYRPRIAISVARKFAYGKASDEERAAAWAAAGAAAGYAAGDAAGAAARAAAGAAAGYAAGDAAGAAAGYAAGAAAGDAAWAAERQWQSERLMAYIDNPTIKPIRLPAKPKEKPDDRITRHSY